MRNNEFNETVKTDDKRRISISNSDRYNPDLFDIKICLNGWQSTTVTVDREMLGWLSDAIKKHFDVG